MSLIKRTLFKMQKLLKSEGFFLSLAPGILLAWLFREPGAKLFFGVGFDIRRPLVQLPIWGLFSILLTCLILGITALLKHFLPSKFKEAFKQKVTIKQIDFSSTENRLLLALAVIAVGMIAFFLINNVVSMIHASDWTFRPVNPTIPIISPVGFDFRIGSYETAFNLYNSKFTQIRPDGSYASIYPPLVSLLNLPYLFVNENYAYLIHVILLILSNFLCLGLVVLLAKEFLFSSTDINKKLAIAALLFLFFMMAVYLFSSYGFMFSIERGNTDIFALLLSLLTVWVLIKRPESLWLQVLLLSIATHLKIYPAVLFLLLLYKHGKKLILPALAVNIAFLFVLGPKMAFDFIRTITSGSGVGAGVGNEWPWIGNHAAYSFAVLLAHPDDKNLLLVKVLWILFSIAPLGLWAFATKKLLHSKFTVEEAFLYTMVSIPLMDLLPTVSMDYKLVILCPAILMLLILLVKQIVVSANKTSILHLLIVFVLMFLIGRGYLMKDDFPYQLKSTASLLMFNKYLWSLALQFVMTWNILKYHKRITVTEKA